MAMANVLIALIAISTVTLIALPCAQAQGIAPAPAPASDGTTIDQGIAYVLMVVALVLTYLIHPMDASSSYYFST
ncbi:arabinogalactan peptide 16 [Phtheirospermum japonicum]|uniref:Arabinogalactan peptide 16 n=1 Tax=Phtheirospermum japonicum TaxID=374723 RepID=A0A830CCL0_9LAMI|nr:arabinogalactan peptide 16 [Phtheirospermum japonicum]